MKKCVVIVKYYSDPGIAFFDSRYRVKVNKIVASVQDEKIWILTHNCSPTVDVTQQIGDFSREYARHGKTFAFVAAAIKLS